MGKITEDELSMLSDEEKAALEGDTEVKSTEEIKAEEEAAAKAKADEGKTDEEKAAEAKAEADAKVATDTAEAAAALAAKEAADLAAMERGRAAAAIQPKADPPFTLEAEKKHGTIEEIEAKMTALDTKFEDGDITLADYNKERAEYVESITEQRMFATINAQVQKSAAEKGWKDSQADFFSNNAEYLNERLKNVAFVDAVNRLLATEESKAMTDAQIFDAAKKECDAVFYPNGRTSETKIVDMEEKRKSIDAAKKAEADRAAGVKTLARVPVSEGNVGYDKFDAIDRLTGDAYENAVAKLSDAERAQYATRE